MMDACTRRTSIKTVTLAGAAVGLAGLTAHAATGRNVKVALVGCGGRGKGDLRNFLEACSILGLEGSVVALADVVLTTAPRKTERAPSGHAEGAREASRSDAKGKIVRPAIRTKSAVGGITGERRQRLGDLID